jgi:hypothetical protein
MESEENSATKSSRKEVLGTDGNQNYPGFEFKLRQVNDSSQSNQVTVHLVSQHNYIYNYIYMSYIYLGRLGERPDD